MSFFDDLTAFVGTHGFIWKLDEASGTVAADATGNARPGTYNNTPTFGGPKLIPNENSTSTTFTAASSEFVQRVHEAWMNGTTWCMGVFLRPGVFSAPRQEIMGKIETLQAWLETTGKISFYTNVAGAWTAQLSTNALTIGADHLIILSNGPVNGKRQFLNGSANGSGAQVSNRTTTFPVSFGKSSITPVYFNGPLQCAFFAVGIECSPTDAAALWASAQSTLMPPDAPGAFTEPLAGDVFDAVSVIDYAFGASVGADTYTVEYWDGAAWQSLASGLTVTNGTWDTSSIPTGSKKLRAAAINAAGSSAWTESGAFTIHRKPTTPVVTVSNIALRDADVSLSAYAHPDGVAYAQSRYQIAVGSGADFASPIVDTTTASRTLLVRGDLSSASGYVVRAADKDANGLWSEWSEVVVFTTIPPVVPAVVRSQYGLIGGPLSASATGKDPAYDYLFANVRGEGVIQGYVTKYGSNCAMGLTLRHDVNPGGVLHYYGRFSGNFGINFNSFDWGIGVGAVIDPDSPLYDPGDYGLSFFVATSPHLPGVPELLKMQIVVGEWNEDAQSDHYINTWRTTSSNSITPQHTLTFGSPCIRAVDHSLLEDGPEDSTVGAGYRYHTNPKTSTDHAKIDDIFAYKNNRVGCSGLPEGWKIQVTDILETSSVTSEAADMSGFTEVDIGGMACPLRAIHIIDDTDTVVSSYYSDVTTDNGALGIFGGDVFTFFYTSEGGTAPRRTLERAWAFTLDGHIFYVLNFAGEPALIYDTSTEQWHRWFGPTTLEGAPEPFWNMFRGIVWKGRVLACSIEGSTAWELDPHSFLDEETSPIARKVTGFLPHRGSASARNGALRVTARKEAITEDATIGMRFSDDNGKTWSTLRQVTLEADSYARNIEFRSLGRMRAPGRIWEISDTGGFVSIEGADADIEGAE